MARLKRYALVFVAVLLVVAVVLGSFFYMNSQANMRSITLGNLPLESSALVYVAEKQGFFKQHGLNVTICAYETGMASVNALLNGELDIASGAEYPVVRMAFQKEKIQIVGNMVKSELINLVGRKDHGIESVSDIRGKVIALPRGTIAEFYLGRFLSLNGIRTSDVTLVNMTLSQMEEAVANGDVDAIVNWQPYSNGVKDRLGSNAVMWSVQSSQQSYGPVICRNDWIKKNPDVVKQFLWSLAQADEFIVNHPAEAKAIVKNEMNLTDAYMETVWKQNQYGLSLDQSLVVALEDEARWMIDNDLTNETAVPNFLTYLYTDGLMSVKPESVNIIR
jgi:NitT/TauT family transport system substrate-binding protein